MKQKSKNMRKQFFLPEVNKVKPTKTLTNGIKIFK